MILKTSLSFSASPLQIVDPAFLACSQKLLHPFEYFAYNFLDFLFYFYHSVTVWAQGKQHCIVNSICGHTKDLCSTKLLCTSPPALDRSPSLVTPSSKAPAAFLQAVKDGAGLSPQPHTDARVTLQNPCSTDGPCSWAICCPSGSHPSLPVQTAAPTSFTSNVEKRPWIKHIPQTKINQLHAKKRAFG